MMALQAVHGVVRTHVDQLQRLSVIPPYESRGLDSNPDLRGFANGHLKHSLNYLHVRLVDFRGIIESNYPDGWNDYA
ncbi:Uncharacterised protein [Mycobacteroides abscessus subsp. abscessus]|nr:Uncharacterised protein [Mycobacteroides abscessus subsp. abscessus]